MISKSFIERPVLSNVIAILMILIGGVALFSLPVAQYPDVVPPTVQVTTRYPGASAKTVLDTVALPIEQQVNGVEDMLYMQSYSGADGTYTLTVTFKIGTDLNFAQVLVQNRVSSALAQLPQVVQNQGVTVQKRSTSILLFVTLTSPDAKYDSLYLSNYATINLRDELSRLPGVGNVTVFGAGQYSMRIWLDPNKLQARGLMPQDVIQAIQQQSQQVAAGQIGSPPTPPDQAFQYTLNVNGRLDDAGQFEDIIVKAGNIGDVTRVRDVGSVELGAQTYSQLFSLNKQPSTGIGIFQSPGANALEVEKAVGKKMTELSRAFPAGIKYDTPFDTTKFVSASIHEVYKTLIEAGFLVLVVILVFLQDWRAMLVPATTVPVTIIGAFAGMAALGFTVNLSTLFAIVLAIGIVVDDAIVVVEGAVHNIERGMSGHDAAIKAMDALFAPIVGITLVLLSVFLPAAFLPGLTGRMYAQFALVIAATALLSAVNAATLKPTQCALWLRRPVPLGQRNFFYRGFNRVYDKVERGYARVISGLVRHSGVSVIAALILIAIGGYGLSRVPTGFIPIEDQGYLLAAVQLPDGASLDRTQTVMDRVQEIASKQPGVDQIMTIAGISALDNSSSLANAGVAYIVLKEWSARGAGQDLRSLFVGLNQKLSVIPEARILVIPPPPIQGIGNAAGFAMQVELRDGNSDFGKLQAVTNAMVASGQSQSALQRVSSGQSMTLTEEMAAKTLPPGTGYEWTAMSYQEKAVGSQLYLVFGLAMLLVYLVLAGQYESWYAPMSVLLAVPLSLLGPMEVLTGLRIENNLYTQIGLILLIALSAKNAILIVEVALELHVRDKKPIMESAIEAARARFRPILMPSLAFILGVLPLVLATGAGANARKSIGITVFSGMLASTCLAVLFVPTFFVVVQRFENWLGERKARKAGPQTIAQSPSVTP